MGERDGYINFFERNSDGTLKSKVRIQADGSVIKPSTNSSPAVVDWNGDGLLDLLVASEEEKVRVYLNRGSASDFQFTTFTYLESGKGVISYMRPQIQVVDLNYDGKKDFILGNGLVADSRIYFYENSGTNGTPVLENPVALQQKDGSPVDPYYDVHFCFTDWNGDGGLDIIWSGYYNSSTQSNYLYVYLGDLPTAINNRNNISITPVLSDTRYQGSSLFLSLDLQSRQNVQLQLFSANGRVIRTRDMGTVSAGKHTVSIDCIQISSGIYIIQLLLNGRKAGRKRIPLLL